MSPKAVGVCSNWGSSGETLCDGGRSMERNQVWSGPTSMGDMGGYDAVG